MTTLYIFGDESGTMPVNDNDKPFVAATVAVLNNTPVFIKGSNDNNIMIDIFKDLNVMPFAAVVKPFYGYGEAMKLKYKKINVMARATRLVTGVNARYFDSKALEYGYDLRNMVWSHAMLQAIAHSVLNKVFTNKIDSVKIILDRKTMMPSMRVFFKEMIINQMGVGTQQFIRSFYPLNRNLVSRWEGNINFSAESTSFSWSDDSTALEKQFGLKLADRLARKIYKDYIDNTNTFINMLKNSGFKNFIVDITNAVSQLDPRIIDNFKKNTGLPEPRGL